MVDYLSRLPAGRQASGHGAQVATRSPHGEVDGLDEVICPVDFSFEDDNTKTGSRTIILKPDKS